MTLRLTRREFARLDVNPQAPFVGGSCGTGYTTASPMTSSRTRTVRDVVSFTRTWAGSSPSRAIQSRLTVLGGVMRCVLIAT